MPDIYKTRFRRKSDFYSLVFWFAKRIEALAVCDRDAQMLAGMFLREFALKADTDYENIREGKRVDPKVLPPPISNLFEKVVMLRAIVRGAMKSCRKCLRGFLRRRTLNVSSRTCSAVSYGRRREKRHAAFVRNR